MLFRLLKRSFLNQKKAMAVMVVSVAVGTAVAASLLTVASEISGKVAVELRSFGANIRVEPRVEGMAGLSGQARYLREDDLKKIKTVFWRHNILGFAPYLEVEATLETVSGARRRVRAVGTWYEKQLPLPGEEKRFRVGVVSVTPWWDVEGDWPSGEEVLLGAALAERLHLSIGDRVRLDGRELRVSGIVNTGGAEDGRVFAELADLQRWRGLGGKIGSVLVSALTTPMDDFAYKDPQTMSRTEYEKWYCTAYVTSVAKQVEEVMAGSRARPIWQVAETEGRVLEKLKAAVYLLSLVSLLASALGVATTMVTSLLRRTEEIGLMKAMGADSVKIVVMFLAEASVIGLVGGLVGLLASIGISKEIGLRVFGTVLEQRVMLFPLSVGISLLIALLGSLLPISRALKIRPAVVLKGAE